MRTLKFNLFLIGLILILVAACEPLLKPSKLLAEHDRVNLARMIPERFASWHQDHQAISGIVDAQVDTTLRRIYDQNLVRTYVNTDGQRIMLNIAYGRDQADDNRLHPPEICYRAQGFMVSDTRSTTLHHASGALPIQQFVGRLGTRDEPVTYWVSYGDVAVVGAAQSRLARLRYVFSGLIPDGILFRVSSVNSQADPEAFALHEKFIKDLITSLSDQDRKALVKPLP
jgi:EpsI family protein